MSDLHVVTGDRLTTAELYGIWKIRDVVFAFEQRCDEPDVDDLDLLPTTTHLWFADEQGPTSYVRFLTHDDPWRLGRVCTRKESRGQGQSGQLIEAAHGQFGHRPIKIGAQSYLEDWYAKYGYVTCGPHYDEAGIDHVPMLRPAAT